MVNVVVNVHPFKSFTVILCVPDAKLEVKLLVATPSTLYVYAGDPPVTPVTLYVPLLNPQPAGVVVPVIAVGPVVTEIVTVLVNVHPLASLTPTVYVPEANPVTGGLVENVPPFTLYEYVGVPPVTAPIVILPVPTPQIILLGVNGNTDGPAALANVAETVNVQPKLFVKVITGVPAPKPVTVCPDTEPKLLAKETVWGGAAGEVFVITTIPFVAPQFGFVKLSVADGIGLTTTVLVETLVQPPEVTVCVTVYVPAAVKLPE